MKTVLTLLTVAILLATGQQARSQTVIWGCPIYSGIVDSTGTTLDSNNYSFELGAFVPGFVPTAANSGQWAANWRVFDSAAYSPSLGYFTSSAQMVEGGGSNSPADVTPGFNFGEQDAYIWVHNSTALQPGTEWFLARSSSWVFPSYAGCCVDGPPVKWSISDLTGTDVPVYGKQGDTAGGGYATETGSHTLQTYSVVPEPASAFLVMLAGVSLLRRRR